MWAVTAISAVAEARTASVDLAVLGFPAGAQVRETDVWTGAQTIAPAGGVWEARLDARPGSHRFVLLEEL